MFTHWFCRICKTVGQLDQPQENYIPALAQALSEHRDKVGSCLFSKDHFNVMTEGEWRDNHSNFSDFNFLAAA